MSAAGQACLMQHLTDRDSVEVIAREGLSLDCVPDEGLRPIVTFAIEYFFQSGHTKAPSVAAILAESKFADALADADISLEEDPPDSIEWALDDLRGTFLYRQAAVFNRAFATEMAEATIGDRAAVVSTAADALVGMAMTVERKDEATDIRDAASDRLRAYDVREANVGITTGMTFSSPAAPGLALIDRYTNGIQDGELAILAAGPKVGKSFFVALAALREWQRGRRVVLYTLENTINMTLDRIACLACAVSYKNWQQGTATADQVDKVRAWVADIEKADNPLWVLRPPVEKRRVTNLVRDAQLRGAQSLYIDQLSHIQHADHRQRHDLQIAESLRELSDLISTGRHALPCLLAHQINREGVKAAHKRGYYEMSDLADSAGVERAADWVFGLHQTIMQRRDTQALFHTLAARRAEPKHFSMIWNVETAHIIARNETTLGEA